MNTELTELVFILDRSGSMGGLESDTIGGFNGMIAKQKAQGKKVNVTTILFDDEVERLFKEIGYTGENVVVNYEVGDRVKITDGPFKMLAGKIIELDIDESKATVSIDLFGQETNVELELTQFTKE